MGANSSKESTAQLVARVKALELQVQQQEVGAEKDYVVVDGKESMEDGPPAYTKSGHMGSELSIDVALQWEQQLLKDAKNRLALAALSANPIKPLISSRAVRILDTQIFNINIPIEGRPVTNQRSSGRCWLFAFTNIMRIPIMKKYNLKEFELSQAYLFFWDKLEKANYFLELVLHTLDEPLDGRLMQTLIRDPVSDGGQYDMAANLLTKYGLVPQSLYPDSFNAMNSAVMDSLITTKLKEDALRLRRLAASNSASLAAAKEEMLREIHLILTLTLGPPPHPDQPFTWQYYDEAGKYHSLTTTPKGFGPSSADVSNLFSLVHDPRHDPLTLLTVDKLGNVWHGSPVTYVNVGLPTMKAAAIAMLRAGNPVFFGCDVGKDSDSASGVMDTQLFDYADAFNVRLGMNKAERLQTGASSATHAMVLTGVHVEKGQSVRWRIENSWSESAGTKGYFVCSDAWFDEWVYQVVVEAHSVEKKVRDVLLQESVVLPRWDPLGALA